MQIIAMLKPNNNSEPYACNMCTVKS